MSQNDKKLIKNKFIYTRTYYINNISISYFKLFLLNLNIFLMILFFKI